MKMKTCFAKQLIILTTTHDHIGHILAMIITLNNVLYLNSQVYPDFKAMKHIEHVLVMITDLIPLGIIPQGILSHFSYSPNHNVLYGVQRQVIRAHDHSHQRLTQDSRPGLGFSGRIADLLT